MEAPPAGATWFAGTWTNVVTEPLFITGTTAATASPLLLPRPLEDEGPSGAVLPVTK